MNFPDDELVARPPRWPADKVIGDIYVIRRVLGEGGMGIVYQGYDQATRQPVAIKVPLARRQRDPAGKEILVRFVDNPPAKKELVQEVRSWIGVAHPHVVAAFDVLDDQSTDYLPAIVMEYCAGGDLARRIYQRGGLTLAEGLDVAIQVCWAMEHVHGKGMVHRDLKPLNVLLGAAENGRLGKALVSDLGLAKALGVQGGGGAAGSVNPAKAAWWITATRWGGTPPYMPPEQWESDGHVGPASDIYAFGVLLFEVFCGRLPFNGREVAGGWPRVHGAAEVPEPQRINGAIPDLLAACMRGCLAKAADERPQSFGELGEALSRICREVGGREYVQERVKPTAVELTATMKKRQAGMKIRVGIGAHRRGDLQDALREFEEAGAIYDALGDRAGSSTCLGNRAIILTAWGRLEEAMELHKEEEVLCRGLDYRAGLIGCLGNQALILQKLGRLEEAMEFLKRTEVICRQMGDWDGLQRVLGNKALILKAWGRLEEAMELLREQETICLEIKGHEELPRSLGNQAEVLMVWGRLEDAMGLHKRAEALCRASGNRAVLSASLRGQATILSIWGQFGEAMGLSQQAEAICRELGDPEGLAFSLVNKAWILGLKTGCRDEARPLAEEALQICYRLGLASLARQIQVFLDWIRQNP